MISKRTVLRALLAAGVAPLAGAAHAQAFPTRPIRMIVPFAAGTPERRGGAAGRRRPRRPARPERRRRQPPERRSAHRHARGGGGRAGRLYAAAEQLEPVRGARDVQGSVLRSAQELRAGRQPGLGVVADGHHRLGAGADAGGVRRLCEGPSGQARLRLHSGNGAAAGRRMAEGESRHGRDQRRLSRRSAGAGRHDGRPGSPLYCARDHAGCADRARQIPADRLFQRAALAAVSGRCRR